MNIQTQKGLIALIMLCVCCFACSKDWLEAKPRKSLIVPENIENFQSLLDNTGASPSFNGEQNSLGELGAGDFYVTDDSWNSVFATERNTYIWASEIFQDEISSAEWNTPYARILVTNVVLEGISKIQPKSNEQNDWNNVKGAALFFRAYSHYDIAQQFCKPFDIVTSVTDLGIPLRLTSDINSGSSRPFVQDTYEQILSDLRSAADLLPLDAPINLLYKLRPTKAAANAMLARVFLSMSLYDSALKYSNRCLNLYNKLMNYNSDPDVNITGTNPFARFNSEVIFYMRMNLLSLFSNSRLIVDTSLYNSFDANDLRRTAFFFQGTGQRRFKGSYEGSRSQFFGGLATDEVFLIRAECNARKGNVAEAMTDLNTLLVNRWKQSVPFTPYTASDAADAINQIIKERRKELCFRGIRWTDLRRLNKESQFETTLQRDIQGTTYVLEANDSKYILPIPPDVIQLSGIQQNQRD